MKTKIILLIFLLLGLLSFSGQLDRKVDLQPSETPSESAKELEYKLLYTVATPCFRSGRCLELDQEVYDGVEKYWEDYDIDIEFEHVYIDVERDINIEYSSEAERWYGAELALNLVRATGNTGTILLNAPMYVNEQSDLRHVLGVANAYYQIAVFKWQYMTEPSVDNDDIIALYNHEIGHLVGLDDHYNYDEHCNLMYGYTDHFTVDCQILTEDQIDYIHEFIEYNELDE